LYDATIFGLTVYKTLKIGRTYRRTMVNILLRDGSLYFGIIGVGNLVNILVLLFGWPSIRGILATYMNVLASTCSARLMLNIRDPNIRLPPSTLDTPGSSGIFVSTIVHAPAVDEALEQDDIELVPTHGLRPKTRFSA